MEVPWASTGILHTPVLPSLQRNFCVRNYLILGCCLTRGADGWWSLLWTGLSLWISPPSTVCSISLCLPCWKALPPWERQLDTAQPTLESVRIKCLGDVCDETLAICRREISSQTPLWRQVSAENLGFINSLYSQLHRQSLSCTEMSEHLTAFINCWRVFVQGKNSISVSCEIRYIEYLHGFILLFRDYIKHKTSTFLTSWNSLNIKEVNLGNALGKISSLCKNIALDNTL